MKVSIDASRCQAHGYCAKFAPTVFTLDEFGYGVVRETGDLSADLLADAQRGAEACPEQAVRMHE